MSKTRWVYFDMDGCLCDLYNVENWLSYLLNSDAFPYAVAKPMLNMSLLARYLNKAQRNGYSLGIISWTSKKGTPEYNALVTATKIKWLKKHLPSVQWDEINIVDYGTCKWDICGGGILFDDEERNRNEWQDESYEPTDIIKVLKGLKEE